MYIVRIHVYSIHVLLIIYREHAHSMLQYMYVHACDFHYTQVNRLFTYFSWIYHHLWIVIVSLAFYAFFIDL